MSRRSRARRCRSSGRCTTRCRPRRARAGPGARAHPCRVPRQRRGVRHVLEVAARPIGGSAAPAHSGSRRHGRRPHLIEELLLRHASGASVAAVVARDVSLRRDDDSDSRPPDVIEAWNGKPQRAGGARSRRDCGSLPSSIRAGPAARRLALPRASSLRARRGPPTVEAALRVAHAQLSFQIDQTYSGGCDGSEV